MFGTLSSFVAQAPVVQGVVRTPVLLKARCAGRGTKACCADCRSRELCFQMRVIQDRALLCRE